MSHCAACRRPLTNPASVKHGFGPDCLKKAVKAGTAPLEALEELAAWQRTRRAKKPAPAPQEVIRCDRTLDLFAQAKAEAIEALQDAAETCRALGVVVNLSIEELSHA